MLAAKCTVSFCQSVSQSENAKNGKGRKGKVRNGMRKVWKGMKKIRKGEER